MNKLFSAVLVMLATFFMLIFMYFMMRDAFGTESLEDTVEESRNLYVYGCTDLGFPSLEDEEKMMLDYYQSQKKISDENKNLHTIVSEQAKEIEALSEYKKNNQTLYEKYSVDMERQYGDQEGMQRYLKICDFEKKIYGSERQAKEEHDSSYPEKKNQSKIARETVRIVNQTDKEVKRFIKKF